MDAKNTISNSIIGLAIIISIAAIAQVISMVLKVSLFGLVPPAYASGPVDIMEKSPFSDFGALFSSIINFAFAAGGLIFFFMLIWGGFRYLTAQGDEKAAMGARNTLTNAAIGLVIIIAAFAIIKLIEVVFFGGKPAISFF